MTTKKITILSLATVALLGTGVFASNISAQSETNSMSFLVEKIATRFNLNKDDVQMVFDDAQAEKEAQIETLYEDRLSQLVSDGKITGEQKELILAKHKELREEHFAHREEMRTMTPEERESAIKQRKTELEQWAEENNIDPKYFLFGVKGQRHERMWKGITPLSNSDEKFHIQVQ